MDLQQLKGINTKFLTRYVKGVPFVNGIKVYERSTFFCQKWYING